MAGRWMCGGGAQVVRVVHGDGQVLSLTTPVKVADILDGHPHHYICHMSPDLPSNKSPMLHIDYELEPGFVYFLLPLPRLFPTSASGPPSCCCRSSNHDRSLEEGHKTPTRASPGGAYKVGFSPLRVKQVKQLIDRIGSPMRSAKKVSPEFAKSPSGVANSNLSTPLLSPTYGSLKNSHRGGALRGSPGRRCVSPKSSPNRLRENANARIGNAGGGNGHCFMENLCTKWKPGLGCISETDASLAFEELRLCLNRRRLTFDSKVRSSSPVRLSEVCKIPARDRSDRPQKEDDKPVKHMSLGGYIFA